MFSANLDKVAASGYDSTATASSMRSIVRALIAAYRLSRPRGTRITVGCRFTMGMASIASARPCTPSGLSSRFSVWARLAGSAWLCGRGAFG